MADIQAIFANALEKNHTSLPPSVQEKLLSFLKLLSQWNKIHNLTAITAPEDMVWLHLMDSLSISPYLHGQRIIDVGTGAGLPGIPLALCNEDKHFTLLDSNIKKTRFLIQAKLQLDIKNIEVMHAHVQNFAPETGFDSIVSRAFASLDNMVQATQHLLRPGGQFLAMKGSYPAEELANLPSGVTLIDVIKLEMKGLDAQRHLVRLSFQKE